MSISAAALSSASSAAHRALAAAQQEAQEASRAAQTALAAANAAMNALSGSPLSRRQRQQEELVRARDGAADRASETSARIGALSGRLAEMRREWEEPGPGVESVQELQEALARSVEACKQVRHRPRSWKPGKSLLGAGGASVGRCTTA